MNRGKGRGSGNRATFRGQRMRGLFADGIWQCDCNPRLPAEHFKVKKQGRNQGRWFYTCQKPETQRCQFFIWDDDAKIREEGAVLNNSRTEPRSAANVGANRQEAGHEEPGNMPPQPANPQYETYSESRPTSRFDNHQGGNSDEYNDDGEDWPLNETDLLKLEETAMSTFRQPQLPPEPRTPTKRSHAVMNSNGLLTPDTNSRHQRSVGYGEASTSKRRATDVELLNLVSPATTPTPVRFRGAIESSGEDPLFTEIEQALSNHGVSLNADATKAIRSICGRNTLRMQGVIKGREISRLALNAKDAKIVELQRRIETFEAELETERAIVRHLRWENEVVDE